MPVPLKHFVTAVDFFGDGSFGNLRGPGSKSHRCAFGLHFTLFIQELHWSHGDGLVLRGLSELPIVPGHASAHPLAV